MKLPNVFNRIGLLVALSLLCSSIQAQGLERISPEEVGLSADRLERLADVMDSYVSDGHIAGSVTMILKNGKIAYSRSAGFRDVESGDLMEEDDIFRIASQTKAIVSTGILILQEEGKLLITEPLGRYLPEWNQTTVAVATDDGFEIVPASRRITIRDLLTHTAGIGYGSGPAASEWEAAKIQGWYFAHREEPIRETVRRMAALPMDRQPGEAFVYGYNTDILGALIEEVSGEPLNEFLMDRVLGPLRMQDTHFYLPPSKKDRLVTVYGSVDQGFERAPDESTMTGQGEYASGPQQSYSGGAGLLSTANDYARFLQMVLNGGELDGVRILSSASIESMLSNHIGDLRLQPGVALGLGFSLLMDLGAYGGLGSVGQFGWGGAYHSTYFAIPQHDMVVVYFTQLIPARGVDDHAKLNALSYQAIIE